MKSHLRNLLLFIVGVTMITYLGACKASEEAEQEEGMEHETPSEKAMMKKDTAEVKVLPPAKSEPESGMQPTTPSTAMVYAVQIGAFESAENASRIEQAAKTRFSKPVRRYYDQATKLHKVSVGSFATKDEALEFRKTLTEKYPGEYNDAWIVEVPK